MNRRMLAHKLRTHGMRALVRTTMSIGAGVAVLIGSVKGLVWVHAALRTALLSMLLSAHPQAAGISAAADVDPAIVKLGEGYAQAVLAKDAATAAAYFRDDGMELPYCAAPVKGRTAIEQRLRALFNSPVSLTAFTMSHLETMVQGDTGYDVGTYQQRWMLPDGKSANDAGKFVAIFKRTQGQWKLAYLIYNTDSLPAVPPNPTNR